MTTSSMAPDLSRSEQSPHCRSKGYPIRSRARGVRPTSANGASSIGNTLATYPTAKYYPHHVRNERRGRFQRPVSKASYKANMQAIITAVKNAGKIPYLAKVPYVDATNPSSPPDRSFSDQAIGDYNAAIDELAECERHFGCCPRSLFLVPDPPGELATAFTRTGEVTSRWRPCGSTYCPDWRKHPLADHSTETRMTDQQVDRELEIPAGSLEVSQRMNAGSKNDSIT